MSVTLPEPSVSSFLGRFEHVRASLRRSQLAVGALRTALVAATAVLLLMAADHALELARSTRAAGLAAAAIASLAVFARGVIGPLRWWSRPRTAAEIEGRFPELGQRIRTVVQYAARPADQLDAEGVTPGLVSALEGETDDRTRSLRLDAVVPRRRVVATALLAAIPALAIAIVALSDREWRLALARTFLGRGAYTTLSVTPGSVSVDQGAGVRVDAVLKGRPRREVILQTRAADRPADRWTPAPMRPPAVGPGHAGERPLAADLAKVMGPLDYRVVAGPVSSPTYRVAVRYPMTMKLFEVRLQPPSYTAIAPAVVKGGDLQAIEGTVATFRIRFDPAPVEAALVLTDAGAGPKPGATASAPLRVPLEPRDGGHAATLTLARSGRYHIEARSADGRVLARDRHRIDIQEDRPPRLAFERPDEALEVHPIAEVVNRLRVADDFGLTRAGIVVRFNDNDEETLIARDFAPGPGGKPVTAATVVETLLLEKLRASSTDSVTYYGFAEDNYPGGARRSETELRYIDIRPFKREYTLAQGDDPNDNGGESTTLVELIARQRYNLNRATHLARHRPTDRTPPEDPIRIATFEEALAGLVREFTEGIEGVAGQRVEPLHQAEEAMLAAVDALDRGQNDRSPPLMAEALRKLIETRQTFRILVGQGGRMSRAARAFDRTQTQKIRRPKTKDQEAEELAAEIEELAKEEDFVYATLNALLIDDPAAQGGQSPAKDTEGPQDEPKADRKDEPREPEKSDRPGSGGGQGGRGTGGQAGAPAKPQEDRDDARRRQEKVAERAREIEERLKRLERVSDLAKGRMAKAAEAAEKAAGALARGSTREARGPARAGSLMLHEVARQVKGEIAPEVADELAMARDLAEDLARQEDEFAEGAGERGADTPAGPGNARQAGKGAGDQERLAQLEEAARTLEEWLKGAGRNAEGDAAGQVRELLEQGRATEIVARAGRVSALDREGRRPESRREARDLARLLETLARQLDALHRGIVAPELARLAALERRLAALTGRSKEMKSEGQVAEWRRLAAELARDLEAAGLADAAKALDAALAAGGNWLHGPVGILVAPDGYAVALTRVAARLNERLQELVLKDLAADRDEATPPEFRELVDRYYQVLSAGPADGRE